MKKLMILACAVAAVAVSQASTYNWNVGTAVGGELYAHSSETKINNLELYLINSGDVSYTITEMCANLLNGSVSFDTYANDAVYHQTVVDGAWEYVKPAFTTDASAKSHTFYYLLKDGDYYFLYDQTISGVTTTSGKDIKYALGWSGDKEQDYGNATYTTGGWYSVPEPTSGLLLLLGVAGLALRRKQK